MKNEPKGFKAKQIHPVSSSWPEPNCAHFVVFCQRRVRRTERCAERSRYYREDEEVRKEEDEEAEEE